MINYKREKVNLLQSSVSLICPEWSLCTNKSLKDLWKNNTGVWDGLTDPVTQAERRWNGKF